ncbi:hypothetical protein D3C81_1157840 [compost metagenome]
MTAHILQMMNARTHVGVVVDHALAQRPNDTINTAPAKLPLPFVEQDGVQTGNKTATVQKYNCPPFQPMLIDQPWRNRTDVRSFANHQEQTHLETP